MAFTPGGSRPLKEEDKQALAQRQARLQKDVDPLLMRRVGRWEDRRRQPTPPSLPLALRPQGTRFDDVLHGWHVGYLGVRGEYDMPFELQRDLKECVPQSVLRDLYRPVRNFFVEPEAHELGLLGVRAISEALKEARAALTREPIPVIEPTLLVLVGEQQRRRRFLATPWQTLKPDSAARRYSEQDHIRYLEVGEDGEPRGDAEAGGQGDGAGGGTSDDGLTADSPGFPSGGLRPRRT